MIFQATGGAVTLGALNVSGSHVDVRDIATGFVDVESGASDVTVRNGSGTGIFIGGGSHDIAFFGGSFGAGDPNVSPVKVQGSPAPNGITFDGVVFHDAVRTVDGAHLECLYAADVQNFTVRNSQFRNCAVMDLFFTKLSGVDPRGITIENNFFDRTGSHGGALSKGYYAIKFNEVISTVADVVIRYNSFYDPIAFTGSFTNTRVVANVGPQTACATGVTFRYNVWTSKTCSATDKQAASGFVDPANYDFHLAAGSAALLAGDPAEAPTVDIDGDLRPTGTRSDAGADQRTGAPPPPPIVPGGGGTPSGGGPTPSGGTGGTGGPAGTGVGSISVGGGDAPLSPEAVAAMQRCLVRAGPGDSPHRRARRPRQGHPARAPAHDHGSGSLQDRRGRAPRGAATPRRRVAQACAAHGPRVGSGALHDEPEPAPRRPLPAARPLRARPRRDADREPHEHARRARLTAATPPGWTFGEHDPSSPCVSSAA